MAAPFSRALNGCSILLFTEDRYGSSPTRAPLVYCSEYYSPDDRSPQQGDVYLGNSHFAWLESSVRALQASCVVRMFFFWSMEEEKKEDLHTLVVEKVTFNLFGVIYSRLESQRLTFKTPN